MFESVAAFFTSLFALLGLSAGAPAGPAPEAVAADGAAPLRVVSLNMCADQYLVELADPGQIAALSGYARDPRMSFHAARAQQLPVSGGTGEELLALEPDLIVGSGYHRPMIERLFADRPVAFLEFQFATSYADMIRQARRVAAALGHPDRGEALIRRIDAAIPPVQAGADRPVLAYYQRRGYLTGTGTLVDEIIARAGGANLAARLDKPKLSRLSLEEMVAAQPDFLLVETDSDIVEDQGREMLQHPALKSMGRLSLPQSYTVCDGPSYPHAIRSLNAQLSAARS